MGGQHEAATCVTSLALFFGWRRDIFIQSNQVSPGGNVTLNIPSHHVMAIRMIFWPWYSPVPGSSPSNFTAVRASSSAPPFFGHLAALPGPAADTSSFRRRAIAAAALRTRCHFPRTSCCHQGDS